MVNYFFPTGSSRNLHQIQTSRLRMNIQDIALHHITAPAYKAYSSEVENFRQFIIDVAQVELQGVNVRYVDFQPYFRGSELYLEDMRADVNQGNLLISTQFNNSELLGAEINLICRAIHDMHHVKLNTDFSWQGECATARYFISLTDNFLFQQILFSQIVGEVAVCLYTGQFPNKEKVVLCDREVLYSLGMLTG